MLSDGQLRVTTSCVDLHRNEPAHNENLDTTSYCMQQYNTFEWNRWKQVLNLLLYDGRAVSNCHARLPGKTATQDSHGKLRHSSRKV